MVENKKCKIEDCYEETYKCGKCKKHYEDGKLTNKMLRRKEGVKSNESRV